MNKIYTYIITILVFIFSCDTDFKPIPKETLIHILADLHMADAALDKSPYKKYHSYDSIYIHEFVFEKYGYSRQDIDSSIAFYTDDIEEIKEIYEKVTEYLQEKSAALNDSINKENSLAIQNNLWNQKTTWNIPEDGEFQQIDFNIPIEGSGKYTLSADIKIDMTDETDNPRMNVYFYKENSSNEEGQRKYFRPVFLQKSSTFKTYSTYQLLTDTSFTHIKGQIISHTNIEDGSWKKKCSVKNIKLEFEAHDTLPKSVLRDGILQKIK